MAESSDERKRVSTCLSTAQIAALKDQLSGSGCAVHEPGSGGCGSVHTIPRSLRAAKTAWHLFDGFTEIVKSTPGAYRSWHH
jgi:hypothetical protein